MPKIKTHRGAAKRFRTTSTGKLRRASAFRRHILTKKSTKRKRQLRKPGLVHVSNHKQIKRLVPYL